MPHKIDEQALLLDIRSLDVDLKSPKETLPVLEGITLSVRPGEVVGIVGESGCGKSILSLSVLGLLPGNMSIRSGEIWVEASPVHQLGKEQIRRIRGRKVAMIFQDPMTSLNPSLTIGQQLIEGIRLHLEYSKTEAKAHAIRLLHKVGLSRPETLLGEYPHQLSGGMRQRVMIAMALSCNPDLIIADEPTTALDVTIQAQILDLLKQISEEEGTAILLVSHDLGVILEMCDRVAVMYAGQIVEEGPVDDIFTGPKHPYTIGLMSSVPSPGKKNQRLFSIKGTVPSLRERRGGCRFSTRCAHATRECFEGTPVLKQVSGAHSARCFLLEERGAEADAVS
ncbi:ABC transporter ATP-binding protein [Paenibacillus tuaregi]|uniref:ABC transporter ATP-binding protein n=1 Tax=Paenibacillus tuaregi TaxID=1816681 RepID=UPI000837FFB0|nr:ABC transporter ATP-binding protein [Paenibacillus tuaregi]